MHNTRTPRSFRTSSAFNITTSTPDGFIVDSGGTDINLVMTKMTPLEQISITPQNRTNGAVTAYAVKFESSVELKDGDQMFINFPEGVQVTRDVSCSPLKSPVGVRNVTCGNVANRVQI